MRVGVVILSWWAIGIAVGVSAPAAAQSNICEYAYDGECDEAYGTGICAEGSDSWDCRRIGPPPGPESCPYSGDGECDEPDGTGVCIPYTDTADCAAEGIDPDRRFFGADDRVWPDSTRMPWRAIGRIEFESGGHCTGTLVGPATVLTSAACMYGGDGPDGLDLPREFVAGASGATYFDRAGVVEHYFPPQFDIEAFVSSSSVDRHDWALLTLDRPIGDTVGWLDVAPLSQAELERWVAEGRTLMQGGYSADSQAFLSANLACPFVQVEADDTILHRCDVLNGDSGSPLFVADGDRYRLVAVMSSIYPDETSPYDINLAVDVRAFARAVQKLQR